MPKKNAQAKNLEGRANENLRAAQAFRAQGAGLAAECQARAAEIFAQAAAEIPENAAEYAKAAHAAAQAAREEWAAAELAAYGNCGPLWAHKIAGQAYKAFYAAAAAAQLAEGHAQAGAGAKEWAAAQKAAFMAGRAQGNFEEEGQGPYAWAFQEGG